MMLEIEMPSVGTLEWDVTRPVRVEGAGRGFQGL